MSSCQAGYTTALKRSMARTLYAVLAFSRMCTWVADNRVCLKNLYLVVLYTIVLYVIAFRRAKQADTTYQSVPHLVR